MYVAIDESGREADDDVFTTASCWYVSTESPESALNPVREALQSLLTDLGYPAGHDESKGKDMVGEPRRQCFESLVPCLERYGAIENEYLPWDGRELRFRHSTLPARQARAVMSHPSDTVSAEEAIRRLMLLEQLTPIFSRQLDYEYVSSVEILPDGDSWDTARRAIDNELHFDGSPSLTFRSGDSRKYNGIQFADVIANTLYRRFDRSDYDSALSAVDELVWQ